MKKVIVTGGAGFIGSHIVDRLIDMGVEVHVIDDLSTGFEENINPKAIFHNVDITKIEPISNHYEFKGTDTIFHCAAQARVQPSIENPLPFHDANVNGTLNILMLARNIGVNRVVYSASSSCYGDTDIVPTPETAPIDPLSPYGLQKYIGEEYCKLFSVLYDIDTVCLRYFNVYGDRMSTTGGAYSLVLAVWKKQFHEGLPLNITNDGTQRRDFVHVEDVVEANMLAATHRYRLHGESYNVGNGKSFDLNSVAKIIGGEVQYGEKRLEPFETLAEITKINRVLGWKPTRHVKEWIKKNF
mgnify:CR=1 FL=1|tara:strand:- start:2514 stop:3410 length:897 start_codon:yes stop_codon:yes gene_type:complete